MFRILRQRPEVTALLSMFLLMCCASRSFAEWVPGERMTKAAVRVLGSAKGINDVTDFGFDTDLSILGAFIVAGDSAAFTKTFDKGREYLILGGGDSFIEDLDLEVKDATGRKIAEDTQTDAAPIIRFKPTATARLTLKATAYKANKGGFVCVVILRKDGWKVPVKNLADALDGLFKQCNHYDSKTTDTILFHSVRNQWALFGSVLEQGSQTTIENIDMGTGKRLILAACDGVASDIDLYAKKSNDEVVAKDEDSDAVPFLQVNSTNYQGARLTYKNVASKKPSLVLMTILQQVSNK